jgi:hypothetical protein
MRGYLVPVISIAMIVSSPSARSDEIPTLDVRPVCRGIASQAAEPLATGLPSSFEQCVKSEEEVREQLKHEWPTFSAADKQHCVTLAKTGGESSNYRAPHLSGNGARCAGSKICGPPPQERKGPNNQHLPFRCRRCNQCPPQKLRNRLPPRGPRQQKGIK